jgi:hypothetical protein
LRYSGDGVAFLPFSVAGKVMVNTVSTEKGKKATPSPLQG